MENSNYLISVSFPQQKLLQTLTIFLAIILLMGYLRDSNHKLSADEKNDFTMQHVEHELIFPKQVEFTLTGISNTEIVEVILFYKISQTGTWQYVYSKISGTGKIKATTVIATSGNSYIPSGVTIEYYFQVKDINGDSFKTQTFTFDYLNPKHKWSKTTKGPLSIYSHGIPSQVINNLLNDANGKFPSIASLAGIKVIRPFTAVIVNNPREASQTFPVISKTSTRDRLYGGFAFKDYGVFLMGGTDPKVLIHESAHLIIGQAIDSPIARIPAWLNEGLAMYFEPPENKRELTTRIANAQGKLKSLAHMDSIPGKTNEVRLFYAHSKSVVKYILDRYGPKKMTQFLHALKEGKKTGEAMSKIYGVSLGQVDEDWRRSLNPEIKRNLILDPGTFWTSSLLALAFLISVTYSGINWLRNRTSDPEKEFYQEEQGKF